MKKKHILINFFFKKKAPLHRATLNKKYDVDMVRDLLKYGANVNVTNNRGETALHWAVRMNSLLVILCLVKSGADVKCKALNGLTPLDLAKQDPGQNKKLIEALQMDASMNSMDLYGNPEIEIQSDFIIDIPSNLLNKSYESENGSISQAWLEKYHPLEEFHVEIDRNSSTLPPIVEEIIFYLQAEALDEEGIFRVSGPLKELQEIYNFYLRAGKNLNLKYYSVHSAAGALKQWFRDISHPVFSYELYDAFKWALDMDNFDHKIYCLRKVFNILVTIFVQS